MVPPRHEPLRIMLTVVIPTYKEAENVDVLLPRLFKTLSPVYPGLKINLIDDDSRDGIEEVVRKHNELCGGIISLIVRTHAKGLASAWKEGIQNSTTPYVGVMDADLAHEPADLNRLMEKINEADMVIGSRYLPHQMVFMEGKSLLVVYLSKVGQALSRFILKLDVYDMSHSLRVFRKGVFNAVSPLLRCDGNAMMIEFTFHAQRKGFRILEVPIRYGRRQHGKTKLGILAEGLKFLGVLRQLRASDRR